MRIPKKGQKIRFTNPATIHWFKCVVEDQEKLEVGAEYTVQKVEVASSATYVWLEEIECYDEERNLPFFSLHAFKWEDEKKYGRLNSDYPYFKKGTEFEVKDEDDGFYYSLNSFYAAKINGMHVSFDRKIVDIIKKEEYTGKIIENEEF